jgi:hypothetical protein
MIRIQGVVNRRRTTKVGVDVGTCDCAIAKLSVECYATVKDSPHPQASLILGLLKTNLELSENGS